MARKNANKVLTSGVVTMSSHVPAQPTPARAVVTNSKDYIPFGSDNMFPQALAELNRKSPVQRSILRNKTIYISGKGFSTEVDALAEYVKRVNPREKLRQVWKKVASDKCSFGNAYIEVVTDARRTFMNLFHKDATKGRVHIDTKHIIFHPNWRDYNRTKDKAKTLPIYPDFEQIDGQLRSVIHIKDYEPEFSHYGLPQSIAAMDAAGIAYKTNKWNLSRLDNSFQSSGMLLVEGQMSVDDARDLKQQFKAEFTGEGNQGKVMFIAKNLGGNTSTQFTPFTSGTEGDWMNLHKQSTDELIIAHNWFPSLSGIATAGALGNTQQIRNEYQIALNTVIAEEQDTLLEVFGMVIENELNIETEDLSVNNSAPINIIDLLTADRYTKIWEARKIAGLDFDPDDAEQAPYLRLPTEANTNQS